MIQTYAHQKELHEIRLDLKTIEGMFTNLITDGTNCSPFESEIIVEKAIVADFHESTGQDV